MIRSTWIGGAGGLIGGGLIALYACHADRDVSTEILIRSAPRTVWQVLTATGDYPAWNPMINRITGNLREGEFIEVDEGMVFHPKVLAFRADQELRWQGHVWFPWIFAGDHRFVLQTQGNHTRFIQSERFTGILVGRLTDGIIAETVQEMEAMNRALKLRAEGAGPPEGGIEMAENRGTAAPYRR
jgi:hypothetical protein